MSLRLATPYLLQFVVASATLVVLTWARNEYQLSTSPASAGIKSARLILIACIAVSYATPLVAMGSGRSSSLDGPRWPLRAIGMLAVVISIGVALAFADFEFTGPVSTDGLIALVPYLGSNLAYVDAVATFGRRWRARDRIGVTVSSLICLVAGLTILIPAWMLVYFE